MRRKRSLMKNSTHMALRIKLTHMKQIFLIPQKTDETPLALTPSISV
ncbi:MAG: hypothetical protein BWX91_01836 [Spirochaetes bacterium ADurb.Bin133]|nr:MAG: hypothetical protein BWX91_01836 [Spirochaetes bacterium ADurb.Bin133]